MRPSKLKTIAKGSIGKNRISPWFSSWNKNELVQATIKQENCTRSTEQDFDNNQSLNPTKNKDAKKQNIERNAVSKPSSGNLLLRLKQYLSRSKQNKKTNLVLSNPPKQDEIKKEIKLEIKEETPDLVFSNPPKQEEIKKEIKYEIKEEGEISDSDEDISIVHVIENKTSGKTRQTVANQKMLSIRIDGQNAANSQTSEGTCALSSSPPRKSPTPTFQKSPTPTFSINSRPCCPQNPCGDCNLCRPALQKQNQQQSQELKAETSLFTAKLANNLWPYKTENQKSEKNTGFAELKAGYFDTRIGKWQPIWQDQSQNQLTSGQNQLISGSCLATSGQHQPPQDGDETNKVTEQQVFNHYPDQNSKKSCQITTNQKSSPVSSIKNETADDQNPEKTCQINANERLRPIIIDGQNVAFEYGKEISGMRKFSARGIEICVEYFKKRGHKEIIIWLPEYRRNNRRDFPENPAILKDLEKNIKWTTARKLTSGKCFASYDDR